MKKIVIVLMYFLVSGCNEESLKNEKFSEFIMSEKLFYDAKHIPNEHRDGVLYKKYLDNLSIMNALLIEAKNKGENLNRDLINAAESLSRNVINKNIEQGVLVELKGINLEDYYEDNSAEFELTKFIVDEYYISEDAVYDKNTLMANVKPSRKELISNNIEIAVLDHLKKLPIGEFSNKPLLIGEFEVVYNLTGRSSEVPAFKDIESRVRAHLISKLRQRIESELKSSVLRADS